MFAQVGKKINPEYITWTKKAFDSGCWIDFDGEIIGCSDSIKKSLYATRPPVQIDDPSFSNTFSSQRTFNTAQQPQQQQIQTQYSVPQEKKTEGTKKSMDTNTMLVWIVGIVAVTYVTLKTTKKAPA